MQGFNGMADADGTKAILEDRKRRRQENEDEKKPLRKHKRRLKERLMDGRDWPIAVSPYGNLERAELDKDDVMAPLPEDMKQPVGAVDEKMQLLRKEADKHQAFTGAAVDVDPGVLARRRRERAEEVAQRDSVIAEKWTEELVEQRLVEAYKTLFRSSVGGVRPKEFGNNMPEVIRQVSDLVHQAGNKSLRNAILHRFKGVPSTDEMRRAEDALSWGLSYLRDEHPDLAGFVNLRSMWTAWGAKITHKCRSIGVHRQVFYRDSKAGIRIIMEGLKRDGKAPT